jgi:hypothetical protein
MSLFDNLFSRNKLDSKINPIDEDIQFINFELPSSATNTKKTYGAASNDLSRVKLAKECQPHFKEKQLKDLGQYDFPKCPGMLDYSRLGYIISAWTSYEFFYNSAGISIIEGSSDAPNRLNHPQKKFNPSVFHGIIKNDDNSECNIFNIESPWQVKTKPGIHMLILPPVYHGKIHDDFHILPGVIDYGNGFHTINLLTGPRRYGHFKINIGDPLFHIIPLKSHDFTATYGYTDSYKNPPGRGESKAFMKNFYRRWHRKNIRFGLKKQEIY